nr:hypothetical protein StreXyl84_42720 [Streptomyces sp. Xyl84]
MELSSPPTYWIGFCTCGSKASSCGKTDSTVIAGNLRELTGGTLKPNPAEGLPRTAAVRARPGARPRYGPARRRPAAGPAPGRVRCPVRYADMGRCTLIDCSRPTATHTANMDEPP